MHGLTPTQRRSRAYARTVCGYARGPNINKPVYDMYTHTHLCAHKPDMISFTFSLLHRGTNSLCIHDWALYTQPCLCIHISACSGTYVVLLRYTSFAVIGLALTLKRTSHTHPASVYTQAGCVSTAPFLHAHICRCILTCVFFRLHFLHCTLSLIHI